MKSLYIFLSDLLFFIGNFASQNLNFSSSEVHSEFMAHLNCASSILCEEDTKDKIESEVVFSDVQ